MDTTERTASALERIAEALEAIAGALTVPAAQAAAGPPAHANLPTFYGYPAAWTTDERGFPSYIITADGEIAEKRRSQDDVWYSTKTGEEYGPHLAKVRAGEKLPDEAKWTPPATRQAHTPEPVSTDDAPPPQKDAQATHIDTAKKAAAAPQAKAPQPGNPFDEAAAGTLRRLHALGRRVHGENGWREVGPERVQVHSDGRAERSDQLSHDEATRLINELQTALENSPKYAG